MEGARLRMLLAAVITGFSLSGTVSAAPDELGGATTANAKAIQEWVDLVGNQHKAEEAYTKYFHRDFVLHDLQQAVPSSAKPGQQPIGDTGLSTRERLIKEDGAFLAKHPELRISVKKIFVSGDLVFLLYERTDNTLLNGPMDILTMFRMRDGKVSDQWRLSRLLPDDFAKTAP
jgi:hypothetical protein